MSFDPCNQLDDCRSEDMGVVQLVVVNRQTPGDLNDFLVSVGEAVDGLEYNLYVANVQPENMDVQTAQRRLGYDDHHMIFQENVGYARAVNYCALRSTSPYLGIFNADVVLTPGSVRSLIDMLEANPNWGAVGPRQTDEYDRITAGGIFGTNDHPEHRGWQQPDMGLYNDTRDDVVTLAGSALMVRRSCWDEMRDCDIFQEVFPGAQGAFGLTPHYYEETLFLYHLRHHGWGAAYCGDIKVIHKWHRASPVGGWAEQQFPLSQSIFRSFCDRHSIIHD